MSTPETFIMLKEIKCNKTEKSVFHYFIRGVLEFHIPETNHLRGLSISCLSLKTCCKTVKPILHYVFLACVGLENSRDSVLRTL